MKLTLDQLISELQRIREISPDPLGPVIVHIGGYAFFEGTIKEVYFEYGRGELRLNVDLDRDSQIQLDRLLS